MRIKKCRKCKTSIPGNARICPYCFKRQWTGTLLILFIILILFIGVGGYVKLTDKDDFNGNIIMKEETGTENMVIEDKSHTDEEFGTQLNENKSVETLNDDAKDLQNEKQEKERLERERIEQARIEREKAEKEKVKRESLEREKREKERLRREQLAREQREREEIQKKIEERERTLREQVEREKQEREKQEKEEINVGSTAGQKPEIEEAGEFEPSDDENELQEGIIEETVGTVEENVVSEDAIKMEQKENKLKE